MNLSSILRSVNKKEKIFTLNPNFSTIRYIENEEFIQDVYKYTPVYNFLNKK